MNWFLLLSYGKQLNYHLSSITLFLFLFTVLPQINSAAPQYNAKTLKTENSFIHRDNGLPLKLLDFLTLKNCIFYPPSKLFVCLLWC